jgi:hypothetical protein
MNHISHFLECYLAQVPGGRPAVVSWNAGIHDMARGQECDSLSLPQCSSLDLTQIDTRPSFDRRWLSLADYTALMTDVSRRLVAAADAVVFATTTPVPTNRSHPTTPAVPEGILDTSVAAYNLAASEVCMQQRQPG